MPRLSDQSQMLRCGDHFAGRLPTWQAPLTEKPKGQGFLLKTWCAGPFSFTDVVHSRQLCATPGNMSWQRVCDAGIPLRYTTSRTCDLLLNGCCHCGFAWAYCHQAQLAHTLWDRSGFQP